MAKVKRTFTREFMDDNDYPWEFMDKELIDQRRWVNIWEGVFEFEGKHYRVNWQEGATEVQEDTDQWFDEAEIEAYEVVKRQVMSYEWAEVNT